MLLYTQIRCAVHITILWYNACLYKKARTCARAHIPHEKSTLYFHSAHHHISPSALPSATPSQHTHHTPQHPRIPPTDHLSRHLGPLHHHWPLQCSRMLCVNMRTRYCEHSCIRGVVVLVVVLIIMVHVFGCMVCVVVMFVCVCKGGRCRLSPLSLTFSPLCFCSTCLVGWYARWV